MAGTSDQKRRMQGRGTGQKSDAWGVTTVGRTVSGGDEAPAEARRSFLSDLRGRLLLITVGLILFALMLFYPLLAAGFRDSWLTERAQAAQIAALAVEAAPDGRVSDELSLELLDRAQVIAVVIVAEDRRELVLAPSIAINGPVIPIDLEELPAMSSIAGAFSILTAPEGRFLQIRMPDATTANEDMEVLVPEAPLKADLLAYSRNLLLIWLIVSVVVGVPLYFALYGLFVRPMHDLTDAITRYGQSPEGPETNHQASGSYEMRKAHKALQDMQGEVSAAFRQRKRLADLGEVVAKINHDLRNSLTTAQIVSEGLSESEDPRVRSAAPRLERAIQRAVGLAESTLSYGKAAPPGPHFQDVAIKPLLNEAVEEVLASWPNVRVELVAADALRARVDPDHFHRIITNLCRNAARAICEHGVGGRAGLVRISCAREDDVILLEIADDGPGIPDRILAKLFQPFAGSGARDGTGLGLAISRELARGMGGELELAHTGEGGTVFLFRAPCAGSS